MICYKITDFRLLEHFFIEWQEIQIQTLDSSTPCNVLINFNTVSQKYDSLDRENVLENLFFSFKDLCVI